MSKDVLQHEVRVCTDAMCCAACLARARVNGIASKERRRALRAARHKLKIQLAKEPTDG